MEFDKAFNELSSMSKENIIGVIGKRIDAAMQEIKEKQVEIAKFISAHQNGPVERRDLNDDEEHEYLPPACNDLYTAVE